MRLQKIAYQVFEREALTHWSTDSMAWHQLDAEIKFFFADDGNQFVSWGSEPEQYCIEQRAETFFLPGVLQEIDMTDHPYWAALVGKEIYTEFIDEEHQTLCFTDGENKVFLSSQSDNGGFYGDCVRVSKTNPRPTS